MGKGMWLSVECVISSTARMQRGEVEASQETVCAEGWVLLLLPSLIETTLGVCKDSWAGVSRGVAALPCQTP